MGSDKGLLSGWERIDFYIKIAYTAAGYENRPTPTRIVSVGLDFLSMRYVLSAKFAFLLAETCVSQRDAALINTYRPRGITAFYKR